MNVTRIRLACLANMEHGWFLTSSPISTANWLAPDNNKWLVPFGAGFGKISRLLDKQPIVWQLNTYYNSIHPRDVPYAKWQVRFQVALLFPAEKCLQNFRLGWLTDSRSNFQK